MNKKEFNSERLSIQAKQRGYYVNIYDDKWKLDNNNNINVGAVSRIINPELIDGYLNTLSFYARNYSSAYVRKINGIMKDFLKKTASTFISESDILNYRSLLTEVNIQRLILLRCFFKKWHSLGYYGIDDNAITLMEAMRLKAKSAGTIVKQEDPEKGALTNNEHKALNESMFNAYKNKKITLQELSSALLVSFTGRRALQIVALKFKDIVREKNSDGNDLFFINVPRIKQGKEFRKEFRMLSIDGFIYKLLMQQVNFSISLIEGHIGRTLFSEEKNEVAVFLDKKNYKMLNEINGFYEVLVSDRLHASKNTVSLSLKKIVEKENVMSERTGERMKINAYRLRYTLGTKLAREGYSSQIIAELLDHSSTATVGIYTENLPDNSIKINEAVSDNLGFLAGVFLGKIKLNEITSNDVFTINSYSSCTEYSTISCHGCIHFKRFKDGGVNE
ncbi:site-specific integrase [Escherichia coli]|uniref:site-specific integrase n=1 Tax=Escherichia coli TaxID=562 RepID=UPI0015E973DE|nr:site-specific integrase [Escherichia coli]EIP5726161.1 tyrosine-type recombinase/integrase [Salmonella enterica]DAT82901.1 MAG TPA: Integrase [Caudoviricetes sp.]EFG2675376.1 phage integrase family protein [Escherichia coli]EIQ6878367.1 tyrosine-type recombinase/integrase [Salmonella enterica]EKN0107790.1 tyrosine-type recombinase/integrase [Salmonella enterica]